MLGLDVALVYYPGLHLASAVRIEPQERDKTISCNGKTYVICDPTYIGAKVGMEMPGIGTNREITVVGD